MRRLAVLAILLVPAVASADPDPSRVNVAGALVVGGFGQHGGPGYDLAASVRVGDVWYRGALTEMLDEDGRVLEPRLGVEVRNHDNPNASPFAGLDLGYVDAVRPLEDLTFDSTLRGAFAMARGGVEVGGEHVRLRIELDLIAAYAHSVDHDAQDQPVRQTGFNPGLNFGLGLIVR